MILPNLIPSQGSFDFKASFDLASNLLQISFRDPATWCQTSYLELKCFNAQEAVRWLYRSLGARFEGDGLCELWMGGSASGTVDGKQVLPFSMILAKEIILTEGIYTIWFTGSAVPYESRQYSLKMLQDKLQKPITSDPVLVELDKSFRRVSFPSSSRSELLLIRCEYSLVSGNQAEKESSLERLAELFLTADLGDEKAIIKQLSSLESRVLDFYNKNR